MKKLYAFLIVFISLFTLVGCTSDYDDKPINDRIGVVEKTLVDEVEDLKKEIESLKNLFGRLGGDLDKLEEEVKIVIEEIESRIETLENKLQEMESYRYVVFKKSDIRTIQIFDKLENKTVVYEIRDNISVEEVIYDTWKSKIYISYVQGYKIELEYIFCTFFVS